jgi:hypothetical protein
MGPRHPIVSGQACRRWPSVFVMNRAASLLALALVSLLSASHAVGAQAPGLVTVELFTSQGCSSCPAADEILNALADRPDVLALTFPVDYWDYLGWRDTLAEPEFTKRQYAYAKALKTFAPYTPQVIVNGRVDVVGNQGAKINWAIADEQKRPLPGPEISVTTEPDSVVIALSAAPAEAPVKDEATVWLVRYADKAVVKVEHGENEDRTLAFRHVVRAIMPVGMWSGAPVRIALPRADLMAALGNAPQEQAFAVIVQEAKMGAVLGAARVPLP